MKMKKNNVFKCTTDSLLLANFVQINPSVKRILDVGTGTGIILKILSNKTNAQLIGVDINSQAIEKAKEELKNINALLINTDIKQYAQQEKINSYDIIVCNPPFYTNSIGEKNCARDDYMLDIKDVIKISKQLLKNGGNLYLVFTTMRFEELFFLLKNNNFAVKELQFIHAKQSKKAKTFLIRASKNGSSHVKVLKPIIMEG